MQDKNSLNQNNNKYEIKETIKPKYKNQRIRSKTYEKNSIKYDTKSKKLYIVNECTTKILHDTYKYQEFYNEFTKNNVEKYDMSNIKYQNYYIISLY